MYPNFLNGRFLMIVFLLIQVAHAQNQPPVISNVSATVDWQQEIMHISFDASDNESDPMEISLKVSGDNAKSFFYPVSNLTGDNGFPVTAGTSKQITWDYPDSIDDFSNFILLIEADDRQTVDIQDIVDQVDSNRLYSNLAFIEGVRHRNAGPAHLEAVKDSLRMRFQKHNLFPWTHSFNFNSSYEGENIIGSLPGMEHSDSVIIIDAHFDGIATTPGADDNGSGVAGVLEAARILSRYNFDLSIKFIGFDLEEAGLVGSSHYVNSGGIIAGEHISGVLNFEMIGYYSDKPNSQSLPAGFNMLFPNEYAQLQADSMRGNFIASIGNANSSGLNASFVSSAQQYVPQLKVVELNVPGNGSIAPDFRRSDHSIFWDAGYEALMLTDGSEYRNSNYHTPNDVIDSLDFGFMTNVVKATVATAASLAGPRHSTRKTLSVSNPVGISDTNWECDLSVYTTAQNQVLVVDPGTCRFQQARLKLIDQNGRLVLKSNLSSKKQKIQLNSPLSSGVYIVQLRLENAENISRKLVVH